MRRSIVNRTVVLLLVLGVVQVCRGEQPAKPARPTRVVAEQGYRVELDLSKQVLLLSVPEDCGWGDQKGAIEAPILPISG